MRAPRFLHKVSLIILSLDKIFMWSKKCKKNRLFKLRERAIKQFKYHLFFCKLGKLGPH